MQNYKDRYVAIRKSNDMGKLSVFVSELIMIVECYENIYSDLKQTIDDDFLNKNKNKVVRLTDVANGNVSNNKRDITFIQNI